MTFTKILITVETFRKSIVLLAGQGFNNFDDVSSLKKKVKVETFRKSIVLLAEQGFNDLDEVSP